MSKFSGPCNSASTTAEPSDRRLEHLQHYRQTAPNVSVLQPRTCAVEFSVNRPNFVAYFLASVGLLSSQNCQAGSSRFPCQAPVQRRSIFVSSSGWTTGVLQAARHETLSPHSNHKTRQQMSAERKALAASRSIRSEHW